jgi:hypothetical protein
MFDEVDEGTALLKIVPHAKELLAGSNFVALDADGCDLPSDWYLLVSQRIARLVKGQ